MLQDILEPLVCERFRSDERYRTGHHRVINALPHRKVVGLHTPQMKEMARVINGEGIAGVIPKGADAITSFERAESMGSNLTHEELMIWGFIINLQKCSLEQRFALLDRFVPAIDNWAVCDAFCANAKWMAKTDKNALWGYLQKWFNSKREFEVRFAIVTSMYYFLNEEWLSIVFSRIEKLELENITSEYTNLIKGKSPYYVRMGIAWLMATALAKFPDKTRIFATNCNLPDDVIKLYIRKARESFRTRSVKAIENTSL